MIQFDCEICGKTDEALLDGSAFGGDDFEGVTFIVRKNDDKICEVVAVGREFLLEGESKDFKITDWRKDPYLQRFNQEFWLVTANECANSIDIFECPKCGYDTISNDMLEE